MLSAAFWTVLLALVTTRVALEDLTVLVKDLEAVVLEVIIMIVSCRVRVLLRERGGVVAAHKNFCVGPAPARDLVVE